MTRMASSDAFTVTTATGERYHEEATEPTEPDAELCQATKSYIAEMHELPWLPRQRNLPPAPCLPPPTLPTPKKSKLLATFQKTGLWTSSCLFVTIRNPRVPRGSTEPSFLRWTAGKIPPVQKACCLNRQKAGKKEILIFLLLEMGSRNPKRYWWYLFYWW